MTAMDYNDLNPDKKNEQMRRTKLSGKGHGNFRKKILGSIGSGLVFGLSASLVFSACVGQTAASQSSASSSSYESAASSDGSILQTSAGASASSAGNVSQIAEKCLPSVVAITCSTVSEVQSFYGTQQYEGTSAGTGIIIKEDTDNDELLIATNNHVVSGAEDVSVCFNDDENQVYAANIKGTDAENDLAVVSVKLSDLSDETNDSYTVAVLGDSDSVNVGDQVVAIGNALGYGQSVTTGCISAKDRTVEAENGTSSSLLQTDAAINPGNSGGALLNMQGQVIGINSAKYSSTEVEGMGYAIPIDTAKTVLTRLMSEKTKTIVSESERGVLGITCEEVSATTAEMYNIPEGLYVAEVKSGSGAEAAGIRQGDIITSVNGETAASVSDITNILKYETSGSQVQVTYERQNNGSYTAATVTVTLGSSGTSAQQA